jgi:serine/threonine-protein kinase HipA
VDAYIEIHQNGHWQQAALLQSFGIDKCRVEYLAEYVFGDAPTPIALDLPVGFSPELPGPDGNVDRSVPAFLYDMVPQGRGRQYLISRLKLKDQDALVMPLLLSGAFNPIGCLRISTAVDFYRTEATQNPGSASFKGFVLRDMLGKSEEFLQHLALHAMLAAGTTGVQGVAPKFLLAQDREGRWFADLALDDAMACSHWLVKLPRGRSAEDLLVHRNEAAYMRVAAACGLRVHAEPKLHGNMLFLRRFDRDVGDGGVRRLHQESLASLAGLQGFGLATTQNALLAALRRHATNPLAETIEFLKRDVLNLALRNTDNHARNTAVQRLADGSIQLTPVFDFAPMFLDPEVVPRSIHWRDGRGQRLDRWADVIEALELPEGERSSVAQALRAFSEVVQRLPEIARDCGVEEPVLEQCRRSIEAQAGDLQALPSVIAETAAASPPVAKRRQGPRRG